MTAIVNGNRAGYRAHKQLARADRVAERRQPTEAGLGQHRTQYEENRQAGVRAESQATTSEDQLVGCGGPAALDPRLQMVPRPCVQGAE